jgi:hypothetical protein
MSDESVDARPDWRLDAVFGLVLLGLVGGAWASGLSLGPVMPGQATVLLALYVMGWGVLFLLSYYFPNRSYLLKVLMWCCEHGRGLQGPWTAVLWGVFAILLGAFALLLGLGVVRP